jgi:DNA-directed RNA polymerase specialized sigma24 family protein
MLIVSTEIHVEFSCDDLTSAQRTILVHRTLGRSYGQIANLLNYSVQTVKNSMSDARGRLHARTNEEACWLARFTGQISDAEILLAYTEEQDL